MSKATAVTRRCNCSTVPETGALSRLLELPLEAQPLKLRATRTPARVTAPPRLRKRWNANAAKAPHALTKKATLFTELNAGIVEVSAVIP